MKKHLIASAMSHLKMQSAEIQRLRREIHEKVRKQYIYPCSFLKTNL